MIYPLTLDTRDLIKGYLAKYSPNFSECTFSNMFMWQKMRPTYFCEIKETLFFLIRQDEEYILFGPPIGPLSLEEALLQLPVKKAIRTTLAHLPNWKFVSSPSDADYVYLVSDLINLPAHKYQKKRQLIRGCLSRYNCAYEPIGPENLEECFELSCELYEKSADKDPKEQAAIERLFTYFSHFDVFGGVIRIEKKVQGFMIAKELNPKTAVGHAEKTSHDFHGLSELMIHWFSKNALRKYTYLNLEQDLGLPGLREAKRRLRPDHMIIKWKGEKMT